VDVEVLQLKCTICGKPLDLRTAQTDGYGKPVHSECYTSRALPPDHSQQHAE